jgi:hypothetical protein
MFDFGIIDAPYRGRYKHLGDHYDQGCYEVVLRPTTARHCWRAVCPPLEGDAPLWLACSTAEFDEYGRYIDGEKQERKGPGKEKAGRQTSGDAHSGRKK